jgi:hypothetical protein
MFTNSSVDVLGYTPSTILSPVALHAYIPSVSLYYVVCCMTKKIDWFASDLFMYMGAAACSKLTATVVAYPHGESEYY